MKRKVCKNIGLLFLFTVMMVSALTVTALAAEKTVSVSNGQITVKAEYDTTLLGQSKGSIFKDGNTVTVTAKGDGLKDVHTTKVTITNATNSNAKITFDYDASNYSSFYGSSGEISAKGNKAVDLEAGASITLSIKCRELWSSTTATLILSNFTYKAAEEKPTVTFDYTGGTVTVDGATVLSGDSVDISSTNGAELTATASDGYKFLGWVNGTTNVLLSGDAIYTLKPTENVTIRAAFASALTKAWFKVDDYLIDDLNVAVELGSMVVPMYDGTLPAGNYMIPSGVTLLIPFDDAHTLYTTTPGNTDTTYTRPTFYCTLTMAEGANITVNGAISLSANHKAGTGGTTDTGSPSGPCSRIIMNSGSSITVNDGAALYAYGFITGSGNVTAKSGSLVYEYFQFQDWRGGNATSSMKNVFPISQYYIQNVEVPMTLEYGAKEYGYTSVEVKLLGVKGTSVAIFGTSGSMFNLAEGAAITKRYDGAKDRLVFDITGGVTLSSVELKLGVYTLNSADYDMALNGNITANVEKDGSITINQDVAMLPGFELNIEDGGTCKLGSGNNIYVYDAAEWGGYCGTYDLVAIPLTYAPGRTGTRSTALADQVDVSIRVDGTADLSAGYAYTTTSGANVYSTGSGKVITRKGTATTTQQYKQGSSTYDDIAINPLWLHNGGMGLFNYTGSEKEYTLTADAASETSPTTYYYCTSCDMWYTGAHNTAQVISNGTPTSYATLQEAINAYDSPADGKYIQMLTNCGEKVTLEDKTVLDLNGYIVKNVTVENVTVDGKTVSGTLYGMDSKTDGYVLGTGDDAPGSIEVSGTVAPVTEFTGKQNVNGDTATLHRYLDVADGSTHTFHRFNISVTDYYLEVLSTGTARIGFGSTFRGDSDVITALTDMGFTINNTSAWANGQEGFDLKAVQDRYKLYYTVDATEMGNNTAIALVKFGESTEWKSDEKTVNFLSALKTYYDKTDAQQKAIIDKFMAANKYSWPSPKEETT